MVVKSLSRKTPSFLHLLRYIHRGARREDRPILHNLRARDRDDLTLIAAEFLANAQHGRRRRGGVVLFHEILSFSPKDRAAVTPRVIEDLTRRYLDLRAPRALAFAAAHWERQHVHVHLCVSGNEVRSRKQVRLSKARFATIKRELQAYQERKYPELEHSRVQHGRGQERTAREPGRVPSRREEERGRRLRQTAKLAAIVRAALEQATSEADWQAKMARAGYRVYRRGQTLGLREQTTGRAYRLRSLGLEDCHAQAHARWQEVERRLDQVEHVRLERLRQKWRGLGFRDDVHSVVHEEQEPRVRELEQLLRLQRQRRRARDRGLDRV